MLSSIIVIIIQCVYNYIYYIAVSHMLGGQAGAALPWPSFGRVGPHRTLSHPPTAHSHPPTPMQPMQYLRHDVEMVAQRSDQVIQKLREAGGYLVVGWSGVRQGFRVQGSQDTCVMSGQQ